MKRDVTNSEVIDNYHGTKVADPFRPLEDAQSIEVLNWTKAQNKTTKQYLNEYTHRKKIKQSIAELMDTPTYSLPQLSGDHYYFHKNSGLQNQPIFYRSKTLQDYEKEVVVEPNRLSEEGTTAIMNVAFSKDGTHMAYVFSYNGSDGREIKIKNLVTGQDYPETLVLRRHCVIAWGPENDGFYYSNYPTINNTKQEDPAYHNRVFWHTIGTEQAEDTLVFEDPEQRELSYEPFVSTNNTYLILRAHIPTESRSNIYYRRLDSNDDSFIHLIDHRENNYTFITNNKDVFYFLTDDNAPKGRVIAININNPEKSQWQEVIPEREETLISIVKVHGYFIATILDHVNGRVIIYNTEGTIEREVPLSGHITITGVTASKSKNELFIGYTSFLKPEEIMTYNIKKDELTSTFPRTSPIVEADYETKQVTYTSKDGTSVPMYIVLKKGLELTGDNPTLLYAYGGYNINVTPTYSAAVITWIQSGGVYAVPNIRGGGEFGREWHEAGMFEQKQNTFDDFLYAADWLIDNGYTKPKQLSIMGGSNGGLLVGVSIIQRPELFGAALCLVPVTDMLRFHKFTFGRFWLTEFGNAEKNIEDFEAMYAYSPLHNLEQGVEYPPTLVTTANGDDRVVGAHARKFAAALQKIQTGSNRVFFKEAKNAGHGDGKPISKIIAADTDLYTFIFNTLNITIK